MTSVGCAAACPLFHLAESFPVWHTSSIQAITYYNHADRCCCVVLCCVVPCWPWLTSALKEVGQGDEAGIGGTGASRAASVEGASTIGWPAPIPMSRSD